MSKPTRLFAVAGLLALAGCYNYQLREDFDMPNKDCRDAAYDDPAVKDLRAKMLSAYGQQEQWVWNLKVVTRQAYQRCLQSTGQAPRGGVQPMM